MPSVYGKMAVLLRSGGADGHQVEELKSEINRLHEIIVQLRRELEDARRELRLGRRIDELEVTQMRTFGEKLNTTLTSVTLIGAVGMTFLTFFGVEAKDIRYDALKEALQGLSQDMQNYQPSLSGPDPGP